MSELINTKALRELNIRDPFFDVEIEGIKTIATGKPIDKKAVIHKDSGQVISVVNPSWNIIQNRELVENFEASLRNDNIAYFRTGAGVSPNLTKFWANYRFPDTKLKLQKSYKTPYGNYQDDIELAIDVWGGYAPGVSTGFMFGGYRVLCSNGLMRKEKLFGSTWNHNRINQEDLLKTFHTEVINASNLFKSNMIQSWGQLSEKGFDKSLAIPVMRYLFKQLADTPTYRDKLYWLFVQRQREQALITMWHFYNMLTWFFTHVMEARSRQRAMKLTANVSNMLMGEISEAA